MNRKAPITLYLQQSNGRRKQLLGKLTLADSFIKRMRGLLGRETLDDDSAIVITPCNLIHTFGMKFNIDVVFLDKNRRIVNYRRDVPNNRVHGCFTAKHTMELAAGSVDRLKLTDGDVLVWQ